MEKSKLSLVALLLFTASCQQDSLTAPKQIASRSANMHVVGDWNCLYDLFTDDLVCWGGAGDWGDQFGLPYGSDEVPGNDPAYYDNTYGWSDEEGYYSGSYGYPWDGNPPDTFDPQWWGYRDNTWYPQYGGPTNDQYVPVAPDSIIPRPRKPWEDSLFRAETQLLKQTPDPHNFCKALGSLLDSLLNKSGAVTMFDNTVNGTLNGHPGVTTGRERGSGINALIDISSDSTHKSQMLQTLRHEGAHALGVSSGDGPDPNGQSEDPNGPDYFDPQSIHYLSVIMNANPWVMNGQHAGQYCGFWEYDGP